MVFLILNVLISSVMMVVFKVSALKGWNGDKIILVNYVAATTISLSGLLSGGRCLAIAALANADIRAPFTQKTLANSIALCLIFGCVQGCMFVVELMVRQASTAQNGAGLTTFFSKSAFVGNILLSAFIWREMPAKLQWLGIGLIVIALILTTGDLKTLHAGKPMLFALLMLGGTVVETMNKAVTVYVLPAHSLLFLSVVFSVALATCLVKNVGQAQKSGGRLVPNKHELFAGVLLGVTNTLASWSSLKALDALPASVVFATQAAGNLLLVFLLGKVVFHEPSSKKLIASLGIAAVSLVLINL